MNQADTQNSTQPIKPTQSGSRWRGLRVWPALFLLLVMLVSYIPSLLYYGAPWAQMLKILGPAISGLLMLIWWLLASRADVYEKMLGMFGFGAAFGLTLTIVDRSMFGMPVIAVTIPMGGAALGISAILFRNARPPARTVLLIVATLIGFGFSTLLRGAGVWGESGTVDLSWRFVPSVEDELVANELDLADLKGMSEFDTEEVNRWLAEPEWPAFRGADRSGVVSGANIDVNWESHPPKKVWTIPIGPGWSSFSVAGELLFTQEQRGDRELVICYSAKTGEALWRQGVEARFEDSIGGPGPRATPTIYDGDLFVQGASGHLMRLDAKTGDVKWKTDLREVTQNEPPTWGYSASPLIVNSAVIVHAGDVQGHGSVLAFDIETGEKVWSVESGDHSYSSAELWSIDGHDYVAMLTNNGFELIDPAEAKIVATNEWKEMTYRALQPRLLEDDSVMIGGASGLRRVKLGHEEDSITTEELWTTRNLQSDFNDYVVQNNYAYGFNNAIFRCVNLSDGSVAWRGGRYGKGQVLLLADIETLLVLTEKGELVLVKASPEGHEELAYWEAIEGKTWNHPVLVGNRLYVRNSSEAACIELPTRDSSVAQQ